MKIETQPLEDRQVKIIAEFDTETLEDYSRRAARKLSRETRVPGFRPGKAPIDLIRRMIGEEAIQQQAVEMIVDDHYAKVLEEANVEPSGPGTLEEVISLDPPKFAFVVPLRPEVKLGDYHSIRLPYEPPTVSDEEIDAFFKRMQRNYATAEPVEGRPAEKGDLVYVMLSGQLSNPAEGEDAVVFPERPAQFLIGDDTVERDWPYVGFDENLIGLSEGDEKTILHTFAEDDEDEALRGKEVEFKVSVQSIKALKMPEIDDEFAKSLGDFETLEDVRKLVRSQMEENAVADYERDYYNQLVDKLVEASTISYPPHYLEDEKNHVLEHLQQDLARQGLDFEAFLKYVGKDRETYMKEEIEPAARKRLERSLVIDQFAQDEKIELSTEDMNRVISSAQEMAQSLPRKGRKDRISKEALNAVTYNQINRVYNERVIDRLKAIATGQADKVEEAEAAAEPAEVPEAPATDEAVAEESPKSEQAEE